VLSFRIIYVKGSLDIFDPIFFNRIVPWDLRMMCLGFFNVVLNGHVVPLIAQEWSSGLPVAQW
jgi:hypothetical protein